MGALRSWLSVFACMYSSTGNYLNLNPSEKTPVVLRLKDRLISARMQLVKAFFLFHNLQKYSHQTRNLDVSIHSTGLDWTTGLDYWTGLLD